MLNIQKHLQSISKKISELKSLDDKINTIASYAKIITAARRCSLFVFDKEKSNLKSIYNDEVNDSIILKSNVGLVGYAFHKKKAVLENDVANNPIFFNAVDKAIHFTTRNILAVPIIDKEENCLGVIELLNKKLDFSEDDQIHIESLAPLLSSILISDQLVHHDNAPNKLSHQELLQKEISTYLEDKRLYLMDNGCAYYKLRKMKRPYFIGANVCYQLSEDPSEIEVYYYTDEEEFLSLNITAKFSNDTKQILISEKKTKENFKYYPFEKDM